MFIMLNINFLSVWMKSVNIHARGEKGASPCHVSSTPRLKNGESMPVLQAMYLPTTQP